MSDTGLRIAMTLPYDWQRRSLSRHDLEALWGESLLVLQVINHIQAPPPREGDVEPTMARLEAKLDLALHLLAQVMQARQGPLHPSAITLWAEGCSICTDPAPQPGDEIVLGLHLSPALALPLKLAGTVTATSAATSRVQWIAMPDAVRAAWEQWLFRQHRRKVQAQRGQK